MCSFQCVHLFKKHYWVSWTFYRSHRNWYPLEERCRSMCLGWTQGCSPRRCPCVSPLTGARAMWSLLTNELWVKVTFMYVLVASHGRFQGEFPGDGTSISPGSWVTTICSRAPQPQWACSMSEKLSLVRLSHWELGHCSTAYLDLTSASIMTYQKIPQDTDLVFFRVVSVWYIKIKPMGSGAH